jgi:hypothetical protein
LIDGDVNHRTARCRDSVADDEARRLVLIVICTRIQRLFAAKKRGKFCAVGDRSQEGCHGFGVFKACRRNENLQFITHGAAVLCPYLPTG